MKHCTETSDASSQIGPFDVSELIRLLVKMEHLRVPPRTKFVDIVLPQGVQEMLWEESNLSPAQTPPADGAPADFDWQAYLMWHEDLGRHGITTEAAARDHYVRHGRAEGRIYKRHRIVLTYEVCGGTRTVRVSVLLDLLCLCAPANWLTGVS